MQWRPTLSVLQFLMQQLFFWRNKCKRPNIHPMMSAVSLYSTDADPHHHCPLGLNLLPYDFCTVNIVHLRQKKMQEAKLGDKMDQLGAQA